MFPSDYLSMLVDVTGIDLSRPDVAHYLPAGTRVLVQSGVVGRKLLLLVAVQVNAVVSAPVVVFRVEKVHARVGRVN